MSMNTTTPPSSWPRALGIGIAVSVLTALVMVAGLASGVSPFPRPPSLAFAETVLGGSLPMPVGLLFHTVYVTFWSVLFLRYFPEGKRDLKNALILALELWLIVLLLFFPVVGWGFAGTQISPALIPASAVPHLLFGLLLWGLDQYLPRNKGEAAAGA